MSRLPSGWMIRPRIINAVIQQKQDARIEIIREFAQSHPTIAPEADATFDIICEENLIHQALVNLVDNAITAMADSETKQLTFHTQRHRYRMRYSSGKTARIVHGRWLENRQKQH